MARQLRLQYPGAIYHVMSRGDRREDISELGLTAAQLEELPANATVKVQLARELRRQTTLSLKRVAEQLGVGSWKYLSNLVGAETAKRGELEFGI